MKKIGKSSKAKSELFPFEKNHDGHFDQIKVHFDCEQKGYLLSLGYEVRGNLESVLLDSSQEGNSLRRHRLWEHTCFELFLTSDISGETYWELNVSPAGDWNLYQFDCYREGQTQVPDVFSIGFVRKKLKNGSFRIEVTLDIAPLLLQGLQGASDKLTLCPTLYLGPTVILEKVDPKAPESNSMSYWALKHLSEQPDFHIRDSWEIHLTSVFNKS